LRRQIHRQFRKRKFWFSPSIHDFSLTHLP
jgi:hypothetical protein